VLWLALRTGRLAGSWQGAGFPAGASNQILLMKWENIMKSIGSEKKGFHALFPKIAIHGNFPLGYSAIS